MDDHCIRARGPSSNALILLQCEQKQMQTNGFGAGLSRRLLANSGVVSSSFAQDTRTFYYLEILARSTNSRYSHVLLPRDTRTFYNLKILTRSTPSIILLDSRTYEDCKMSSDSATSSSAGGDQQMLDVDELHYVLQEEQDLACYMHQESWQAGGKPEPNNQEDVDLMDVTSVGASIPNARQEGTQKKTFTNWINSQLSKHPQSSLITDLFIDLQNGHMLLDLLEVLSGEQMRREKGKNVFQSRSNIDSALTFLGKQSIKLINIHVEDIISGKPSIVLGLIWKIILHFHIESLADILADAGETGESTNGVSSTASPPAKKSAKSRWKLSAKKVLLQWAKEKCAQHGSINVTDFKSSWKNGLAFLAIIQSLRPDLVDMDKLQGRSDEANLKEAFRIAESELHIPRLLEPEDVNVPDPDEKSIMTYVAQFLQYSKCAVEPKREMSVQVKKAVEWLNVEDQTLKELFASMRSETYSKKYHEMLLYMRKFNEQKKIFLCDLEMKSLPVGDQQLIRKSLENITSQIAEWKKDLDRSLPPPLNDVEAWLANVEKLMAQKLHKTESHHNTVSLLQNISTSYKALMSNAADRLEAIKTFKIFDEHSAIFVPSDKIQEMEARVLTIMASDFCDLVDYRCFGHHVLALLEEVKSRLQIWKGKYKTRESVESLLEDWKDFVEGQKFMVQLETAFQKFKDLNLQLVASDKYSEDSEISKEFELIESKYTGFVESVQQAKSDLENVISSWTHFEKNIELITFWLDEQQKIPGSKVPIEILSKWKSVLASLNKDGNVLMERIHEKTVPKLSGSLKSVNKRWTKYVKMYKELKGMGNGNKTQMDAAGEDKTLSGSISAPLASELHLSEEHIRKEFESSKGTLETYITRATLLLGQRLTPDEFISQYEDALAGFSGLDSFLKYADEMKNISSPNEKTAIDSMCADIRCRWQVVHSEIESYVFHLKMHIEKKKFDELLGNLEKQINKEKGCVAEDVEEAIGNHKVLFSEEHCQSPLNGRLQAMRTLSEATRTPGDCAEIGALIDECGKKMNKLESRASEVYLHLLSRQEQYKAAKKDLSPITSETQTRTNTCRVNGTLPSQEISTTDFEDHNGLLVHELVEGSDSTLKIISERYDEQGSNLESFLETTKERLASEIPREAQGVCELQSRLQELQELQAQTNSCWTQFDVLSRKLANLVDAIEKTKLCERRNLFQSELNTINEEVTNRIQSLYIAINVLLPIEQDVSLLCERNPQLPNPDMEQFTLSTIDSVFQELKDVQISVDYHIQQCDHLEASKEIVSSPVDFQSVQTIVHQYKTQLEATNESLLEREAILKALEKFLSSLSTTKISIETTALVPITDKRTLQEKRAKLEALEKEIYQLQQEAETLDVSLQTVDIILEDPEVGGETSCQKLISGFFERVNKAQQSVVQDLRSLEKKGEGAIQTFNGSLYPRSMNEPDSLLCGSSHQQQGQETEQFTTSEINSVLQKIKKVRSTFEEEIKQTEILDPSSAVDRELSPSPMQADLCTVHQYRMQLSATSETITEREHTLKCLDTFLSSLRETKQSVEAASIVLDMDRTTLGQKQKKLEALEKDIYRMGQEAEKLDSRLQASEIVLEDPDGGGQTSCQKMIATFFERVERAQLSILHELRNLAERERMEAWNARQKEFCKCIQDIQDQADKVGLKDPTIPSVRKRMKTLVKLEKELDSHTHEKDLILESAAELLHTTPGKDIEGVEYCEGLWEETRQCILYSKEQCETVLEMLRKFQTCRTLLISLIQKGENTIAQQSSYMGKDNLRKMIAKVEALKREYNDQSETADEINNVCKILQFHLNKMKSFENPPFHSEANQLVDKWLDICEKMESYEDHLKNAFCLWNKIVCLSEAIEQWCAIQREFCENTPLTEQNRLTLDIECQNQEINLDEISEKIKAIQNLLQSDEPPLELQVIQTSLMKQIELIREHTAGIPEKTDTPLTKGADMPDAPLTTDDQTPSKPHVALELNTNIPVPASGDLLTDTDELTHYLKELYIRVSSFQGFQTVASREEVNANTDHFSMQLEHKTFHSNQSEHPTISTSGPQRLSGQTPRQEDKPVSCLDSPTLRLIELRKRQELLNSGLQPGLQEKLDQLASFKQLLQETQSLADSLEEGDLESTSSGPPEQWIETKLACKCFLDQIQDTMRMLESRIQRHRRYESLSTALSSKMTSFSEELLNFTASSLETAASEQKRHKLQVLHEALEKDLKEISPVMERVKRETCSLGVSGIEKVMEACHSKMRGFTAQLESLRQNQESPLSPEKRRIRKAKKAKQMPPEPLPQPQEINSMFVFNQLIAECSIEQKLKMEDQQVQENTEPLNQEATVDYKAQNMCAERKIDADVTDGKSEPVEDKPLKETTAVGKEQGAIGQLDNLSLNADSSRRPLEASLSDLAVWDQELHQNIGQLSSTVGTLYNPEMHLDNVKRDDLPKEAQTFNMVGEFHVQTADPKIPRDLNVQTADPKIPGHLNVQTADPKIPGHLNEQSADPKIPGDLNEQSADPKIPGDLNEQSADPKIPGDLNEQSADPKIPGDLNQQSADPKIPGDLNEQSADPKIPRDLNEQSADPKIPGDLNEQSADPKIPGDLNEQSADPKIPGDLNEQSADPKIPGDLNQQSADPKIPGDLNEQSADPKIPGDLNEQSADPKIPSDLNEQSADPKIPGDLNLETADIEIMGVPSVQTAGIEITGVPSVHTADIEITGVPSVQTASIEITGVPSVHTADIEITGVPSVHTAGIEITGVHSVHTADIEITGSPRVQTAGIEITGASSVQTAGIEITGVPSVQTAGIEITGVPSVHTAGIEITGVHSVHTADIEITGAPSVQTAGIEITGVPSVQTADIEITGVPSVPTADPMITGVPSVQTADIEITGVPSAQTTGIEITGVPSVHTADIEITGLPSVQTADIEITGVPSVQSADIEITGVPSVQTADIEIMGVPSVQTADIEITGVPSVQTADIEIMGVPSVQTAGIEITGVPSVQTADIEITGVPSVQTADIEITGVPSVHTADIEITGVPSVQTADIEITGVPSVQTAGIEITGVPSVQTADPLITGVPSVQTADIEITGASSVQTAGIEITGVPSVQTADIEINGSPRVQTADIEITGAPSVQTAGIEITGVPSVQTAGIEITGVPSVHTAGIEITGVPSVQTADPMITGVPSVQTADPLITGAPSVHTAGIEITGVPSVQTADPVITGVSSVQTAGIEITGVPSVQTAGIEITGVPSVQTADPVITGVPSVQISSEEILPPWSECLQTEDLQLHLVKYLQDLEVIFGRIPEILQVDFKSIIQPSTEESLHSFLRNMKSLHIAQNVKVPSEENKGVLTQTCVEEKVQIWKNLPLELDGVETDRHIHEIEDLYEKISKLESSSRGVQEKDTLVAKHSQSPWGSLLCELEVLKTRKQSERQAIKDYTTALQAAKSSLDRLTKERENLKMGPTETYMDYLERIQKFLYQLEEEKDHLHALRGKQAKFCSHRVSHGVKEKIDIDVKQIDETWEQAKIIAEKKRDHILKEAEEVKLLKQEADRVRDMIITQRDLLDQDKSKSQGSVTASLVLNADLEAIKHVFSSLRNTTDLQMKRSWGQSECRGMERSLEDLQSQLENLEHGENEGQQSASGTPDFLLEEHSFLRPLFEVLLWVKKSQSRTVFEHRIALLPEDLAEQIIDCRNSQKEMLDRMSTVQSSIDDSKCILSERGAPVSEGFGSFFQQLQELYEEQIILSANRLQLLEGAMERRKTLFSEIEKLEELLQNLEGDAKPVERGIYTPAQLCQQIDCLKAKTTELRETEGLVLTLLKNSRGHHHELKISEQLYLNDILRSLKSKASRLRRLEENKCSYLKKIQSIYSVYEEKSSLLTRELNTLQPCEPELNDESTKSIQRDSENKLHVSRDAEASPSADRPQLHSYKELFDECGLYWDSLAVDNLQARCESIASRPEIRGQEDVSGSELVDYQKTLRQIKILVSSIERQAGTRDGKFNPTAVQVLCKKIKKISVLTREAFCLLRGKLSPDLHMAQEQKMRGLVEKMDGLQDSLSQMIKDSRTERRHKESIQCRLKHGVADLKKMDADLLHPLFVELDTSKIEEDLMWLEATDDIRKAELTHLRDVIPFETTYDLKEQLDELNDLEKHLETSISQHIETSNESLTILQKLQNVLLGVPELFGKLEAQLCRHSVDLASPQNGSEDMDLLAAQRQGLDMTVSEIRELSGQLKPCCKPEAVEELNNILLEITTKHSQLIKLYETKHSALTSCQEKYQLYKGLKRNVYNDLEGLETILRDSFAQRPMSYKAALMHWEKSKEMVAKICSCEEELSTLKPISREVSRMCAEGSSLLLDQSVTALWNKWLYWLSVARDWEWSCEELNREWKLISEEMEREMILLDHYQEEAMDRTEKKQSTRHLLDALPELKRFEEHLKMQQLQLSLLMRRIRNIRFTSQSGAGIEPIPITKEIQSMKNKCKILQQKSEKNVQEIHRELQERDQLREEISAVKKSIVKVRSALQEDLREGDPVDYKLHLEELQSLIDSEKVKANKITERLAVQYSDRIPVELLLRQEECQTFLQETEDQVKNEVIKSSPTYIMTQKVEEVNSGLQSIEVQLTQKSKNIIKAKELQKKIWDELDNCHSKLIALESDVQDIAEDDPTQAQEWMDNLTEPFRQYQQVSYLVERRTVNLNKAASKLEEYEENLKSTNTWLQNTDSLLNEEMKDCSAKVLHRHFSALEIALDDSEQKHNILDAIHGELGELTLIFETDHLAKRLGEISNQVRERQQRIIDILPHIQHVTSEVIAIETEVKRMKKKTDTIKTILTSNDIDDMSPKEHRKNGEVILENIESMKKTIGEIEAYKPDLGLSESGVQSLCVFRRTVQLLKEIEILETSTKKQNELLEPIIIEMTELEQEQEKLKHLSKNVTYETSDVMEKAEAVKGCLEGLNQKKEAILNSLRSSLTEQLENLQQEESKNGAESLTSPVTEEPVLPSNEAPQSQTWMESYFMPSLAEETEEDSFVAEESTAAAKESNVDKSDDKDNLTLGTIEFLFSLPFNIDALTRSFENCDEHTSSQLPPPSHAPVVDFLQGDPGKTLAAEEMVLIDCQERVVEMELWLERLNLSLVAGKQEPDIQPLVDQQLADILNTWEETEKKVNALMEGDTCGSKEKEAWLEEAESLSRKLKSLKFGLEHVQDMLQLRPTNEQFPNGVTVSLDTDDPLKLADHGVVEDLPADSTKDPATELPGHSLTGTRYHGDELELGTSLVLQQHSRKDITEDATSPQKDIPFLMIEDTSWSKWQYLLRDLLYRMKHEPTVTKDVRISVLPRFPVSRIKMVTSEEQKTLAGHLDALTEDISDAQCQRALFVWLFSTSQWLQTVEEMLDTDVLTKEEALSQLAMQETLSNDLETLSIVMANKKDAFSVGHDRERTAVLFQCYDNIQTLLSQTRFAADSKTKSIQTELEKNNSYQNDITLLYEVLVKKKTDIIQYFNNGSAQSSTQQLQEATAYETELNGFENQVSTLKKQGEILSVPVDLNQDVYKLEDVLNDTWRILRTAQVGCTYTGVMELQTEAMEGWILDLLTIGKEKVSGMKDNRSMMSKDTLVANLKNFKGFFSILCSQLLMLETVSEPAPSRERLDSVAQDAQLLQKEAETHCIHMMEVLQDWQEFDSQYDAFRKEQEALASVVPSISLVEETEERVTERLSQYQQIKEHIDANESRLCQIVLEGRKVLTAVNCQELEAQITIMEQQWSQLSKRVNHELHRLESLVRHLASYSKQSAELSVWSESARQKLKNMTTQSLDASQDLGTVRRNLAEIYEFTNVVDQKSSVKTLVLITGNQLLLVKESDSTLLKVSLAKIEEKWAELIAALPVVQEKLQQLLMEKLPSCEVIHELMTWIDQAEDILKDETGENSPASLSEVKNLLQECKGFRKQMCQKQWIVDFVNQSLLQLSVGDVESKRYERTEFAEHLGTINLQWNQMQGNLNRKIQLLEQTLQTASENKSRSQTLSKWFEAQELRLTKLQQPSSIPDAERVLAECADVEEQLISKSASIEDMKTSGVEMAEGAVSIPTLSKQRDSLANQVAKLKSSMPSLIQHWKTYNANLQSVKRMTIKILYILEQDKLTMPSLHFLKSHMKSLQLVQEDVEQHEENWTSLKVSVDKLNVMCSPSVRATLEGKYTESAARWSAANQALAAHVQSAQLLLRLWEAYAGSYLVYSTRLAELEGKWDQLLGGKLSEDRASYSLKQRVEELQELENQIQEHKADAGQVSELADKVKQQNPAAAALILCERETAIHRITHLERNVSAKAAELKLTMKEVDIFKSELRAIESRVMSSAEFVDQTRWSEKEEEEKSSLIKQHLLQVCELSAVLERLNEESFTLPLDDHTLKMLQQLNRTWSKTEASALEHCRANRMNQLQNHNFIQNYETWMQCLEKMENSLAFGIGGTMEVLKTQQHIYERLEAEITINEQILPSFVNNALILLEGGGLENRQDFILKLSDLREKWHSVIRLVQQRKKEVNTLLKQWWAFNRSKQRIETYLAGMQSLLASVKAEKCHSRFHTRKLLYDLMDKERRLNRWSPSYLTAVAVCKDLQAIADPETKKDLQSDLTQLQSQWMKVSQQLGALLTQINATVEMRQNFEWKIKDRRKVLRELTRRVDQPLPTLHEELLKEREPTKELEEALDEWNQSLQELDNMRTELSQYILAEDWLVLKKQVEALYRQWEELCLRVSMRKQEIEDRLNAWNVFNEKNKELCDWLTRMETKALQTADVNIEEMIEKLQKDCMEEINLFSENKNHLKQIGDQLIIASNKARATEIDNKLHKIDDRWQHLFDVIGSRVKRLKETLVVTQQLDKKMSNLRTWLSCIESELSKPVIYSIYDEQEIQRKLTEQQDLQKDIEHHSAGVASVLNICERLLNDTDACTNDTECDSIQQTTRSLDKRWRNICTLSMERRIRIEETWRLWQKFLEDYSRFEEWLEEAETMAALPDSSEVLYTKAKEEQKKFEAFQRQIHERLTHLELINKQYRRLARENRTDAASKLKHMVHEGNQRWDQLQRRVSAILRRLKHFTSQREEFEGTRDNILVWLTEIDLQLTNVEHFSESDIDDKMRRLIEFQQEITLNTNKVDQLIVFGEQLIQRSEAIDAVNIEDELEELHRYFQEVFGRVSRFHQKLTNRDQQLEEERETSENDTDAEDSREFQNTSWHSTMHEGDPSHQSLCHLMPPTLPHERSGRETPVSVDSIPLEWDPTVDVGGSSMHENEEVGTYYNALSDVEITENPEAYVIMTTKSVQESSGKSDLEAASWHSPDKHISPRKLGNVETVSTTTADTNTTLDPPLVAQTTFSASTELRTSGPDQQSEDQGLRFFGSPETSSGVIERWEILQAQSLRNELRVKQAHQQRQQLTSDLNNTTLWLEKMETDLANVRNLKPASTLKELKQKAKRLKDILKSFDHYKALLISANLRSTEFQQVEDLEARDVLNRLHEVNTQWDRACYSRDHWRESLQNELFQCEEYHDRSDQLLIWLIDAHATRLACQITGQSPDVLRESQKQLLHMQEQLRAKEKQVKTLNDLSSYMHVKMSGDVYNEAEEKLKVIISRLDQLKEEISHDLRTVQEALDNSSSTDGVDAEGAISPANQASVRAAAKETTRHQSHPVRKSSNRRSFLYRVLRMAFPLQFVFLLLLLLARLVPYSEEDYSCTQANNFARSFYPMLRYTNGPPPT
ncbi:LOW QUALITY PROTEIN: nesprin-2 [Pelodytes ibericus]